MNEFCDEFSSLLEHISTISEEVVITGDFNIHIDNVNDRDGMKLRDLLDIANLTQHVNGVTHLHGHTLDLLISRTTSSTVTKVDLITGLPSDHNAVHCLINLSRPKPSRKEICYRKVNSINVNTFKQDILTSSLVKSPSVNISQLVDQYNNVLQQLLDNHAPLIKRKIFARPNTPWYKRFSAHD